jgi:hypothetical protein
LARAFFRLRTQELEPLIRAVEGNEESGFLRDFQKYANHESIVFTFATVGHVDELRQLFEDFVSEYLVIAARRYHTAQGKLSRELSGVAELLPGTSLRGVEQQLVLDYYGSSNIGAIQAWNERWVRFERVEGRLRRVFRQLDRFRPADRPELRDTVLMLFKNRFLDIAREVRRVVDKLKADQAATFREDVSAAEIALAHAIG